MMGKRVLIVDDESDLRYALAIRLRAAGFLCETAENGEEGLAKARQAPPPDLLIVDLLMPKMNGYEMLQRLKADPATAKIPAMVLTALPERARERQLAKLDSVIVMQKPFHSEQVVSAVQSLLDAAQGG
ncbi:MAG: response regulator [Candidatus Omnitrophica bacterium]|nr:response regulator [Candidatus Omnitrophota bacterium]